jgi:hypothetical protein
LDGTKFVASAARPAAGRRHKASAEKMKMAEGFTLERVWLSVPVSTLKEFDGSSMFFSGQVRCVRSGKEL